MHTFTVVVRTRRALFFLVQSDKKAPELFIYSLILFLSPHLTLFLSFGRCEFFQFRATHLYTGARDSAALQTAMFLIASWAGRDRSARVVVVCGRDAMFVCITIGSVAKMVHHHMFTSHPRSFFFFCPQLFTTHHCIKNISSSSQCI